jgi:hypothetical protein
MASPAVSPIAVTPEAREMVAGSVRCKAIPVSPVIPFNVIEVVFPVGGTMVTALGVTPVEAGTEIELNPLVSA